MASLTHDKDWLAYLLSETCQAPHGNFLKFALTLWDTIPQPDSKHWYCFLEESYNSKRMPLIDEEKFASICADARQEAGDTQLSAQAKLVGEEMARLQTESDTSLASRAWENTNLEMEHRVLLFQLFRSVRSWESLVDFALRSTNVVRKRSVSAGSHPSTVAPEHLITAPVYPRLEQTADNEESYVVGPSPPRRAGANAEPNSAECAEAPSRSASPSKAKKAAQNAKITMDVRRSSRIHAMRQGQMPKKRTTRSGDGQQAKGWGR